MNRKVGCYFQILGDMYSTLQYTIVYYSIYIAIYHSLLVYQPTFLNILAKPRALEALSLISTNSSLKLRQESPMASLREEGPSVNCTTLHDSSLHLLLSGFSPEVWRMRQHSSIRVSRLSPVHSRRCAAMSLWRRRWEREGTLTESAQTYTFCSLLSPSR